jgi:hypothetical protein
MYDRGHGMSQHPGLILKSLFYRFTLTISACRSDAAS